MTASRAEVGAVFISALLTGVLFGMLPALSTVLTSPDAFDLSPTLDGLLFAWRSSSA